MTVPNVDDLLGDLSAELRSVEPSAEFAGRVRETVRDVRTPWPTWGARVVGFGTLAAAVIAGLILMPVPGREPSSLPRAEAGAHRVGLPSAHEADPATSIPESPIRPPSSRTGVAGAGIAATNAGAGGREPAASMPLTLVPTDQAEALERLLAARRRGRVYQLTTPPGATEPLPELAVIEIPEIVIEPVPGPRPWPTERKPR